jgi:hypothetical protein
MDEENEYRKWFWGVARAWHISFGAPDPEAEARQRALAADRADEARMEEAFKQAHPQLF